MLVDRGVKRAVVEGRVGRHVVSELDHLDLEADLRRDLCGFGDDGGVRTSGHAHAEGLFSHRLFLVAAREKNYGAERRDGGERLDEGALLHDELLGGGLLVWEIECVCGRPMDSFCGMPCIRER